MLVGIVSSSVDCKVVGSTAVVDFGFCYLPVFAAFLSPLGLLLVLGGVLLECTIFDAFFNFSHKVLALLSYVPMIMVVLATSIPVTLVRGGQDVR